MGYFSALGQISLDLKRTEDKLSFTAVKPTIGDWGMVSFLMLVSIPLSWFTTKDLTYASVSLFFYWIMAYSLIDDRFDTVIEKSKNSVSVTKSKTGRIKWVRVSQADELVNAEVVEIKTKRSSSYRLELEFMSELGGYYRLQTSDTTVLGDHNRKELEKLALEIRDFMDLKPLPESLKEESLRKSMPTSMKKEERDALRRRK